MRFFGFEITRAKALNSVGGSDRGWFPLIRESFTGAWQKNVEVRLEDTLAYWPVFRCISLISGDIAKLGLDLVQETQDGVWQKVRRPAFSPVLRKPNRFQTRIQFFENWLQSKLTRGNTYILKQRDNRGVVVAMYVLAPDLVRPLVSDDGSVFYELFKDNVSGIEEQVTVPASEIIHDRWNCLYHPLVGLSPIYAAGMKAVTGLRIQNASAKFFEKGALPSGVLTAPATITDETAKRLKEAWDNNYSGVNAGKVAVLGDGLKFERMTLTAEDSQLIEQLKWTAEAICGAFGVPVYKVFGPPPTFNNIQALQIQYYTDCLQILIESVELLLDEGLGLTKDSGRTALKTRFNLENLLRMDTATQFDVIQKAKGTLTLNESRRRVGSGPVDGGDTIYLQQQDHSLAAIAARDAMLVEQAENQPGPSPEPEPTPPEENEDERNMRACMVLEKELGLAA